LKFNSGLFPEDESVVKGYPLVYAPEKLKKKLTSPPPPDQQGLTGMERLRAVRCDVKHQDDQSLSSGTKNGNTDGTTNGDILAKSTLEAEEEAVEDQVVRKGASSSVNTKEQASVKALLPDETARIFLTLGRRNYSTLQLLCYSLLDASRCEKFATCI
jgi:hypothetical protein